MSIIEAPDHTRPGVVAAPAVEANRPSFLAIGMLLGMAAILFAGTWKSSPLISLVAPMIAMAVWWPTLRSARAERWLFVYVAGIYAYTILRSYADEFGLPAQSSYVIAFDKLLFGGDVPSYELQREFFRPWAVGWLDLSAALIHASFFIAPHAALVMIWRRWPQALRPYVLSALLTLYVGLLLFFLVPTVPPWLAGHQGDVRGVYRVIDFVFGGANVQVYNDLYAALAEPNSVAAVPSIHMAITCIVMFRAQAIAPRWVLPLAVYAVLMGISLVYLGEHYVFDVIAGVLIAVASETAVRWLETHRLRAARASAMYDGAPHRRS